MSQVIRKFQPGGGIEAQSETQETKKKYPKYIIGDIEIEMDDDAMNQLDSYFRKKPDFAPIFEVIKDKLKRGEDYVYYTDKPNKNRTNLLKEDLEKIMHSGSTRRYLRGRNELEKFAGSLVNSPIDQLNDAAYYSAGFRYNKPAEKKEEKKKTKVDKSTLTLDFNDGILSSTNLNNPKAEQRVQNIFNYLKTGEAGDYDFTAYDEDLDALRAWRDSIGGDDKAAEYIANMWNAMKTKGYKWDPEGEHADFLKNFGIGYTPITPTPPTTPAAGTTTPATGSTSKKEDAKEEEKQEETEVPVFEDDPQRAAVPGSPLSAAWDQTLIRMGYTDLNKPTLITRNIATALGLGDNYLYGFYYKGRPYSPNSQSFPQAVNTAISVAEEYNNKNLPQSERVAELSKYMNLPSINTFADWQSGLSTNYANLDEALTKLGISSAGISDITGMFKPEDIGTSRVFKYYNNLEKTKNPFGFKSPRYIVFNEDGSYDYVDRLDNELSLTGAIKPELEEFGKWENIPVTIRVINGRNGYPDMGTRMNIKASHIADFSYKNGQYKVYRNIDGSYFITSSSGVLIKYNVDLDFLNRAFNKKLRRSDIWRPTRFSLGGTLSKSKADYISSFQPGGKVAGTVTLGPDGRPIVVLSDAPMVPTVKKETSKEKPKKKEKKTQEDTTKESVVEQTVPQEEPIPQNAPAEQKEEQTKEPEIVIAPLEEHKSLDVSFPKVNNLSKTLSNLISTTPEVVNVPQATPIIFKNSSDSSNVFIEPIAQEEAAVPVRELSPITKTKVAALSIIPEMVTPVLQNSLSNKDERLRKTAYLLNLMKKTSNPLEVLNSNSLEDIIRELVNNNTKNGFYKNGGSIKSFQGGGWLNFDWKNLARYASPVISGIRYLADSKYQNDYTKQMQDAIEAGRYHVTAPTQNGIRVTSPVLERAKEDIQSDRQRGSRTPVTNDAITNYTVKKDYDSQLLNRENQINTQMSDYYMTAEKYNNDIQNKNILSSVNASNQNRQIDASIDSAKKQQEAAKTVAKKQSFENLTLEGQTYLNEDWNKYSTIATAKGLSDIDDVYLDKEKRAFGNISYWNTYNALPTKEKNKYLNFWDYMKKVNTDVWDKQNGQTLYDNWSKAKRAEELNMQLAYGLRMPFMYGVSTAKKGGRLNGKTRYTLEPDERIWIDNNKAAHAAIAKLNDNTIKLLLRALK